MTHTVLIVDDSLTVRMDLAEAFQEAGFQAFPCASGQEARAILGREAISAAVLDVLLPDTDGVELLKELRASNQTSTIPILMLSSEAEVKDRVRGLQTGADDYVGKPYDTGYVVARTRELLRARQPAAQEQATILIIDDSLTFRASLQEAFEAAGYLVQSATNGEDGLRLASTVRPSAIVVDGVMPGIDGATVIRRLRLDSALRGTPCLLLTASDEGGAELHALDAGADAFVHKGEDLKVIMARLGAILRNAQALPAEAAALLEPKRILVVDDSETYLQMMGLTLRNEGYDVVLARSGEQALEMLSVQTVDCMLLDLVMPGMSGKETCLRIKAAPILRDVPLIIVTSMEDRDAMIESLGIGADDYIGKSADFDVLKARVRAQIRRKQFEDENRHIREELLRHEMAAAEARAAREVAEAKAAMSEELENKNRELEAFSYSVSHDLRAPLRGIDGFSQMLLEEYHDQIDETGQGYLTTIRKGAQKMGALIDDLLRLSKVSRGELKKKPVDLSQTAREVVDGLRLAEPDRAVEVIVTDGMVVDADASLLGIVLQNLVSNAWKFSKNKASARIEVGVRNEMDRTVYFVSDNGAGFDMAYAAKLFTPFQRLHSESEFPGTGIGLAIVQRVIHRHGGRIWAESTLGEGAAFCFTLTAFRN